MCGFVGFCSNLENIDTLKMMSKAIRHRGPDDSGYWQENTFNVFFAHRRLSILELSKLGHQPMTSPSGRFTIIYNGEIYNHLELRKLLEKNLNSSWKGNSDTETILYAFEIWGVEETLKKCIGMFAFALWDNKNKDIILARDRFGEKPLYYGMQKNNFIFGSELKALRFFPKFNFSLNTDSLKSFLKYSYVPSYFSIYSDVFKLLPGSLLIFSTKNRDFIIKKYYDTISKIRKFKLNELSDNIDDCANIIDKEINKSVKLQSISDVPLGSFLSSGIDSSLITSILQSQNPIPVKTFSIGFYNHNYNEADKSKKIAEYLKTDHHELYVSNSDMLNLVEKIKDIYCEPFGDSSQIPTLLVSKLASENVKVVLSGDGADELFGGYNRHRIASKLNQFNLFFKLPIIPRLIISKIIRLISNNNYEKFFGYLNRLTSKKIISQNIGDKIYKIAKILPSQSINDMYLLLTNYFLDTNLLLIDRNESNNLVDYNEISYSSDYVFEFMLKDLVGYLPDDILCKVDRASMHYSLESRMPYLNHNLVEMVQRIPSHMKIEKNITKLILRKILSKYLPKNLITKSKMGFAAPINEWLRKPLYDWANSQIDSLNNNDQEIFNIPFINKIWIEHKSSRKNWDYVLWNILVFQDWYKKNI